MIQYINELPSSSKLYIDKLLFNLSFEWLNYAYYGLGRGLEYPDLMTLFLDVFHTIFYILIKFGNYIYNLN